MIDKEKYFKNMLLCPYCDSDNLSSTAPAEKEHGKEIKIQPSEKVGRCIVECLSCKKKWEETYKLLDVIEVA